MRTKMRTGTRTKTRTRTRTRRKTGTTAYRIYKQINPLLRIYLKRASQTPQRLEPQGWRMRSIIKDLTPLTHLATSGSKNINGTILSQRIFWIGWINRSKTC